jgi:amino acid transporter
LISGAIRPEPVVTSQQAQPPPTRVRDIVAGIVAIAGLAALVAIAAVAIFSLPSGEKGANVVAISSSALGVIGPIVGAYFGVRSAANAIEQVKQSR